MRSQRLMKNGLVVCLLLTLSFGSMASDTDRITQLEKEVQELKTRLSSLESALDKAVIQKPTLTSEGWRKLANWRSLKKGMSFEEVREILGEPGRVTGGTLTDWTYPDQARVTFLNDRLFGWTEPR
jgi:hypothetical protein